MFLYQNREIYLFLCLSSEMPKNLDINLDYVLKLEKNAIGWIVQPSYHRLQEL